MADPKQLPHLLKLLDDETSLVRDQVSRELAAFGDSLGAALLRLPEPPDGRQRRLIAGLLAESNREWLVHRWPDWFDLDDDGERLEAAFSLLAEYLSGRLNPQPLSSLLDGLAREYREAESEGTPRRLARHLFGTRRLRGNRDSYYHPQNCNLIEVIGHGHGLPISLAAVYMLTGRRLGLDIEGCNFPGHFLARVRHGETFSLVDCYNGGRFLDPEVFVRANPNASELVMEILKTPVTAESMIHRALNNLARAQQKLGAAADLAMVQTLIEQMTTEEPLEIPDLDTEALLSDGAPRFETGQVIRHRRYGYRGVVVDFDLHCRADEAWYRANPTQPDRDQPWYSVLVDRNHQVTYAAETSLEPDDTKEPVDHPLVEEFFRDYAAGRYVRNMRPWSRG